MEIKHSNAPLSNLKLSASLNAAYPDGKIMEYFRDPGGDHGDTLALFLVSELCSDKDAWPDRTAQLKELRGRVGRAVAELEQVRQKLTELLSNLGPGGIPCDKKYRRS